jgi:hypothetical protein
MALVGLYFRVVVDCGTSAPSDPAFTSAPQFADLRILPILLNPQSADLRILFDIRIRSADLRGCRVNIRASIKLAVLSYSRLLCDTYETDTHLFFILIHKRSSYNSTILYFPLLAICNCTKQLRIINK